MSELRAKLEALQDKVRDILCLRAERSSSRRLLTQAFHQLGQAAVAAGHEDADTVAWSRNVATTFHRRAAAIAAAPNVVPFRPREAVYVMATSEFADDAYFGFGIMPDGVTYPATDMVALPEAILRAKSYRATTRVLWARLPRDTRFNGGAAPELVADNPLSSDCEF